MTGGEPVPPGGNAATSGDRFSMTGRAALVTGGSRGLGRAMALGFAEAGADVIIVSRKLEQCETTAEEIRHAFGRRAVPLACNVGHWDQCDALVARVDQLVPGVDVLVNNAGLSPRYDGLPSVTEALYDKTLAVNLKGPFRLSVLLGERMAAGAGGTILNIGSTEAVWPEPDALPYAMAKAALNTMTKGLAKALGPRVRVNAIMAGPFRTDVAAAWPAGAEQAMARRLALRRIGEAHEIVGAALLLCSEAGSYCTGAVLGLDGGAP